MKSFWTLVKFEALASLVLLIYPLIFGGQFWFMAKTSSPDAFLLVRAFSLCVVTLLSFSVLFQGGTFGFRGNLALQRTLEFPFTRAISRKAVYGAKMTLLFSLIALTLIPGNFFGFMHPDRKVQLFASWDVNGSNEMMRTFYLSHFQGATESRTPYMSTLILPHAQAQGVMLLSGMVVLFASIYAALMLGTTRFRRFQRVFPMLMLFSPILLMINSSSHLSTHDLLADQCLAWGVAHAATSLIVGTGLVALAIWFAGRKFVEAEVLD